jgi:hypothetical protein
VFRPIIRLIVQSDPIRCFLFLLCT